MTYSIRTIQARVAALGFDPGPIDGQSGPKTRAAIHQAMNARRVSRSTDLFHRSGISRVHWHWTAGEHGLIEIERRHYNDVIDRDGFAHPGMWAAEDQAAYSPGRRGASHTLNANTGAIGISMDCMAGARERPFEWGTEPMTWDHVNGMLRRTADYCRAFDIPVSRWSTLSHAEIEPTLGIPQRQKWDIAILPDMDRPGDPVEVGDRLRDMLREMVG